MRILIPGVIVLVVLAYYAYSNAMNIQYKLRTKRAYTEEEFNGDRQSGATAVGIIMAIVTGLISYMIFLMRN